MGNYTTIAIKKEIYDLIENNAFIWKTSKTKALEKIVKEYNSKKAKPKKAGEIFSKVAFKGDLNPKFKKKPTLDEIMDDTYLYT